LLRIASLVLSLSLSLSAPAAQPGIAAGSAHSLALDAAGTVWAWGSNANNALGLGAALRSSPLPQAITGLPPMAAIAARRDHSLALDQDGRVWAWGEQTSGSAPQLVTGLPQAKAIAQAAWHALVLARDGTVWAWGSNANCQYGNGSNGDATRLAPAQVPGLAAVNAIVTGYDRSYARLEDGSVWLWGCLFDDYRNAVYAFKVPTRIDALASVWPIAVGIYDDAGVRADGEVLTWGAQASLHLGVNDMFTPWAVGMHGARAAAIGTQLLVLNQTGGIGGLFANGYGQLGNGSSGWAQSPVEAIGVTRADSIAAGDTHSLYLDADAKVWAAGDDSQGQTGTGAAAAVTRFQPVRSASGSGQLALGHDAAFPPTTVAIEFYNATLNHYFITASDAEVRSIDGGGAGPGWSRTGSAFRVWQDAGAGTTPVCRFYGNPALGADGRRLGPNSHFYTASPAECEAVKSDPGWLFEGVVFHAALASQGVCGAGRHALLRAYNNRYAQNDSNHRYLVDPALVSTMLAQGWSAEGVVMCLPW
jgi:alpha-tubulin suppressor-like RCC1 family protein